MNTEISTTSDGTVEECIDEIGDFVAARGRYPGIVLAQAFGVHLASILRVLIEGDLCTREQIRDLLSNVERDAL